jgi:hypothetical protein
MAAFLWEVGRLSHRREEEEFLIGIKRISE